MGVGGLAPQPAVEAVGDGAGRAGGTPSGGAEEKAAFAASAAACCSSVKVKSTVVLPRHGLV